MKPVIGLVAVPFAKVAFAQNSPPKVGNKPLVQVKPQAAMGCKLVGRVKGIKLWAGDCVGGAAPADRLVPGRDSGAIPDGHDPQRPNLKMVV